MIICLDSNILIKEFGLNTSLGSAVRLYMNEQNAKLLLPDVVKLEVKENLFQILTKHTNTIKKNHNQLLSIFGELKEIVLPSDNEIKERIDIVFDSMKIEIIEEPFTIESARSSFLKTIKKEPPSLHSQQFKDGVIWNDCIKYLDKDDVFLITNDKAFFENKNPREGIAKNLLQEIQEKKYSIKVLSNLSDLIKQLDVKLEINKNIIRDTYLDKRKQTIIKILEKLDLSLDSHFTIDSKVYATENVDILYLEFILKQYCSSADNETYTIEVSGYCDYDRTLNEIRKLQTEGEKVYKVTSDGSQVIIQNHVLLAGSLTIGHKTVVNSTRYDISDIVE